MNRKNFLSTSAALIAGSLIPAKEAIAATEIKKDSFIIPAYLKQGDIIGITSPAGTIKPEELKPAISLIEGWGYQVRIGQTIGKKDNSFGGTDEERREDLQMMLDDADYKAILCARGGYGAVRIVDSLDWKGFKKRPKWVIGFSDITVLLNHIHTECGVAAIHSKMCNSFPDDWSKAEQIQIDTILSIKDALEGKPMKYTAVANAHNVPGTATGVLVGGNLKTIESLAGTPSDINTKDKILFVEDTGEYLYSIDRMFWNLKRTGKLERLKGLIIGGFKVKPDDPGEEFGRTVEDIVLEKVKGFNYPICFDFPVGHQRPNFALKCGAKHQLIVSDAGSTLTEVR